MSNKSQRPYSSGDLRKLPFNERAMIIAYDVNNGLRTPVKIKQGDKQFFVAFVTEKEKAALSEYAMLSKCEIIEDLCIEEADILASYDPDCLYAEKTKGILKCMALSND